MIVFIALYLFACGCLFFVGARALFLMTRKSCHLRRVAFVLMTAGAASAFVEVVRMTPPVYSGPLIAVGMAILFAAGSREERIAYRFDFSKRSGEAQS